MESGLFVTSITPNKVPNICIWYDIFWFAVLRGSIENCTIKIKCIKCSVTSITWSSWSASLPSLPVSYPLQCSLLWGWKSLMWTMQDRATLSVFTTMLSLHLRYLAQNHGHTKLRRSKQETPLLCCGGVSSKGQLKATFSTYFSVQSLQRFFSYSILKRFSLTVSVGDYV